MHDRNTQAAGFTLVELLVVLGLFVMVMTAAVDIFLLTSRSQRKVFSLERAQSDARFTLEAMVREIRTGSIDFSYYASLGPNIPVPADELALLDSTGTAIRFRQSGEGEENFCANADSAPCLLVIIGGGTPASITPKGVKVDRAKFYVRPSTDPAAFDPASGTYGADIQPQVTVVLALTANAVKPEDRVALYVQTTTASRDYGR